MTEILWTAGFFNERFPAPVSPLGWSVIGPLIERLALRDPLRWMGFPEAEEIPASRLYHGHPYANVAVFQILYNPFPDFLLPEDAVRYFPGGDTSWRKRAAYPGSLFNPRFLFSLVYHYFAGNWLAASPLNFLAWSRYLPQHERVLDELNTRLARANEAHELFALIGQIDEVHSTFLKIHRWSLTYADLCFGLLKRTGGIKRAERLVAHTPNKTIEIDNALRDLARLLPESARGRTLAELRGDPADKEFVMAFDDFLDRHGHRSFSLDISMPTFAEAPDPVLRLVTEMTAVQSAHESTAQRSLNPFAYFAFRYVTLREDQRYYWQKALACTRRAFLRLGDILAGLGALETRDDIFYALRLELGGFIFGAVTADELRELVLTRKAEWAKYESEFQSSPDGGYPPFLRGDQAMTPALPNVQREWHGRGVSGALARGPARIARHYSELDRIRTGDILVAPATDPAWTPVFARVKGLVLERGGMLSHGSVIAREYGLAAVVGLTGITDMLGDGDMIEVDGVSGTVRRV